MKRSEMLKAIHDKLIGKPIHTIDWEDNLLTIMEELGMLPPATSNAGEYVWAKWEPEDEYQNGKN